MATVNIGKSNAGDAFYRYKMPRLATKIEGRGNGIKTNIMNNVDVAKALDRPPQYVVKYYGCELGAQTNFDDKTGTSIVNGAHQTTTISELLEGFIKKFVQCYSCGNPETVVKIDKRDNITLKCKACGASSDVDPRHKLCTYILKNPPEPKMSKAERKIRKKMAEAVGEDPAMDDEDDGERKSKKKDKKEKKEKKEKKDKKEKKERKSRTGSDEDTTEAEGKEEAGSPDVEDDDDDDDTEWMTDTSAAAVAARVQEQLSSQTAAMVTIGNLEEEEAARKKAKKEAKRAKKAEKEARAKLQNASIDDDDEDDDDEDGDDDEDDDDIDIPALRKYILSRTPEDAVKALTKMEVPGGTMGTLRLLWQVVFGEDDEPLSGKIGDNKEYLVAFLEDANSQLALLGGLEHFVTVADPSQVKETPKVLKALYDMDIVEEEVILAWAKKAAIAEPLGVKPEQAAECRAAAKPVIDWLEEADEESDDEA